MKFVSVFLAYVKLTIHGHPVFPFLRSSHGAEELWSDIEWSVLHLKEVGLNTFCISEFHISSF